jgi:predicted enzyme related to lactoylglutathione lyase
LDCFPTSTHYFDPSPAPFMVNYIVDDLDALLDRLKQEGVKIDAKRMNESYSRFAWIYDLDGNRIELWQPQALRALRTSASLLLCDRKL